MRVIRTLLFVIVVFFAGSRAQADDRGCGSDFAMLRSPEVRSSLFSHVLNGQFRNGQLSGGLHTWQGLEKFRGQLMRERGFTRLEAERALRIVVEKSPNEPAVLHIDSSFFPGAKDTQKTLFPRSWNVAKVIDSIRYVSENPRETIERKNGEKVVTGIFEGVTIVLRVGPDNIVRAAYPEIRSGTR